VKQKHKSSLKYGLFAVLVLAACAWGGWALLQRSEPEVEGFIPGVTNVNLRSVPAHAPKMRFTPSEITFDHFPGKRSHRLPEDMGSGAALEDFDGDGDLDLFCVNNGPMGEPAPACALFRNDGGEFKRVEGDWPKLLGNGVAAGDYDGDSDFDLYVTGYKRTVLLRNDGNLRFTDVTEEMGVSDTGFGAGACWGDVDGDGDLDLYVCRYVEFDENAKPEVSQRGSASLPATLNPSTFPAQSNLLFIQEDGKFVERAKEAGVDNPEGKSLAALFVDFDADGNLDLYVANDVTDNVMFRGLGNGKFEDVSHASCTADWRGAMGLAVGDADSDADLDMFVTHWKPEENALYVQERGMFFKDDSMRTYLGPPGRGLVGWACDFVDFDGDGRPDLYVINGSTFERPESPLELVPMQAQLFWNSGERFYDLAPRSGPGWAEQYVGRGAVAGDVDGDRDIDLIVMRHSARPLLLRNETEGAGRMLEVRTFGSGSNPFAYGATVTVEVGKKKQTQVVGAKVSYLCSGPHLLSFGLDDAKQADRVIVRFASGKVVERRNVLARRPLDVKEVDARLLGPRMDAARDALVAGDDRKAVEELRALVELDPMHATALYLLAQLVPAEEAFALCDRLVRIEPMLPRGHLLRAKILADPLAPELMDLDAALAAIAKARQLNRDETGGALEEGRVLILQGKWNEAAAILEKISTNPRAAALAALCHFRLGDGDQARTMLRKKLPEAPKGVTEEGDTAERRVDARDELARLLMEAPSANLEPVDGAQSAPAPERRVFEAARRFALSPPKRVDDGREIGTVLKCDVDGDGDDDYVYASAGHALLPLPWWTFLRDEKGEFVPVRGPVPNPAYVASHVARDGNAIVISDGKTAYRVTWPR
jgi:tetratricopeptide (TPR) repeat protein